jgi:hypothetical protein
MPKKIHKAAIIIDEKRKKELMDIPDDHTFFKLILDLDNEKVEIITIPFSFIKEKLRKNEQS